eukprot:gene14075-54279_t
MKEREQKEKKEQRAKEAAVKKQFQEDWAAFKKRLPKTGAKLLGDAAKVGRLGAELTQESREGGVRCIKLAKVKDGGLADKAGMKPFVGKYIAT